MGIIEQIFLSDQGSVIDVLIVTGSITGKNQQKFKPIILLRALSQQSSGKRNLLVTTISIK